MIKNKETIVFFNGVYLPHIGGVERYTHELAKRLSKNYRVYIVTSNTENAMMIEDEGDVRVFRFPVRALLKNRLPILKKNDDYRKLLSAIKSLEIDHIICNTRFYETTFMGLKIAKERGITPMIIDHSGGYTLRSYEDFTIKRIAKYNPKFYSVSNNNKNWLKRTYGIESNGIIYNSVDRKKDFKKQKNEKIRILFAGRLVKTKGLMPLLSAFERLRKKYDIELVVVGKGPLMATAKAFSKHAIFLGGLRHQEVIKEFEKADIFVCPSLAAEGLPTTVLEAGINKCAIIATEWDGIKEIVGDDGVLIDKKANGLSNALEELLNNRSQIEKYQERIFKRVNNTFVWDKTIEVIEKELEK